MNDLKKIIIFDMNNLRAQKINQCPYAFMYARSNHQLAKCMSRVLHDVLQIPLLTPFLSIVSSSVYVRLRVFVLLIGIVPVCRRCSSVLTFHQLYSWLSAIQTAHTAMVIQPSVGVGFFCIRAASPCRVTGSLHLLLGMLVHDAGVWGEVDWRVHFWIVKILWGSVLRLGICGCWRHNDYWKRWSRRRMGWICDLSSGSTGEEEVLDIRFEGRMRLD